jgi:hypothetical protein
MLAAAALGAALACAGAGSPEETLEAFHGHMAAKDFARAAELVSCRGAEAGPEAPVARLAEVYERDDLDYGRAEMGERRPGGPGEVEFTVSYRRRSRPSTPPVTRRVAVEQRRGGWYVIVEPPAPQEKPARSE